MNKTYQELCDENQQLREGIRAAATKLDARELSVTVTTDPDLQALEHAIALSRTDRDDALNVAIKGLNAALLARNGRRKLRDHPDFEEYRKGNDAIIANINKALAREKVEKEALAAHAERQDTLLEEHFEEWEADTGKWDEFDWHDRVARCRLDTPKTSLAQRDARVAADELYRLYRDSDGDNSVPRGIVLKRAEEKRRQAEGVASE